MTIDLHPQILNGVCGGIQPLVKRLSPGNTHSSCVECGGKAAAQLRPYQTSQILSGLNQSPVR